MPGFSLFTGTDVEVPEFAKVAGRGRQASKAITMIRDHCGTMEIGDTADIFTNGAFEAFPEGADGKKAANAFRSSIGTNLKNHFGPSGVYFTPKVRGFADGASVSVPKMDKATGEVRTNKNGKPLMQKSFWLIRIHRVETPVVRERKAIPDDTK